MVVSCGKIVKLQRYNKCEIIEREECLNDNALNYVKGKSPLLGKI